MQLQGSLWFGSTCTFSICTVSFQCEYLSLFLLHPQLPPQLPPQLLPHCKERVEGKVGVSWSRCRSPATANVCTCRTGLFTMAVASELDVEDDDTWLETVLEMEIWFELTATALGCVVPPSSKNRRRRRPAKDRGGLVQ